MPIVIIFKEYEYTPHFRTLFKYLPKIFANQYSALTKSIILESTNTIRRESYKDYNPYVNGLTLAEFCDNDLWINYGNPYDILTQVAINDISYDMYFVWDRTYTDTHYIHGSKVQLFSILENIEFAETYKLHKDDIVSSKTDNNIIDIENYDNIKDKINLLPAILGKSPIIHELHYILKSLRGDANA